MDIGGNGGQAQHGASSVSYIYNFLVMPRHKKVVGYYVIPSEVLSVCPSIRPSAVHHSCPLHKFDTVRDNFTKLGTNIKHDQTTCRRSLHLHFAELFPFVIFSI